MKNFIKFLIQQKSIFLPLIFLVIFVAIVIAKIPLHETFEYNTDEGVNLIKTKLFLNGFPLYKTIWNDQPPLFTIFLSWWFRLFGCSIEQARILILLFSAVLLFAFYQIIKTKWGNLCASIGVIFLALSASYFELSLSVMIGIPALSLAMLSIYGVTLFKKLSFKPLLVLSGILMALSLQTKFFTALLIPIISLEIAKQRSFSLMLLWLSTIITTYLGIAIIFFHPNFSMLNQQLFQPHLIKILPSLNFLVIWKIILADFDIFILALTGVIILYKKLARELFVPAAWLTLALIILILHKPIWQHYYLLLSIPACWLAAISLSECFFSKIKQGRFGLLFRWLSPCLIILIIIRLPIKYNRIEESIETETAVEEQAIIKLISKYKPSTRWIFTDRPIFAFYADMLVPPELAVFSHKRILTGNLQPSYIISVLEKYKPELILLDRFQGQDLKILPYLEKNYSKIYNYKEEPFSESFSYELPSYKGKNPLMKWLRYVLWRYKLKTMQNKIIRRYERSMHSHLKLAVYLRKDIPK